MEGFVGFRNRVLGLFVYSCQGWGLRRYTFDKFQVRLCCRFEDQILSKEVSNCLVLLFFIVVCRAVVDRGLFLIFSGEVGQWLEFLDWLFKGQIVGIGWLVRIQKIYLLGKGSMLRFRIVGLGVVVGLQSELIQRLVF